MGDLSAEPSMEDILSSIKRIIAEEGEAPGRPRRPARIAPAPGPPLVGDDAQDEVLELSDPMPAPRSEPAPAGASRPRIESLPIPAAATEAVMSVPPPAAEPIVSAPAAAASRGALDQLSRLMVRPEPGSEGTLEGLVRDMLRPMLSEWLDANLPRLVEEMVAREIKRITAQQ